MSDAPPKVSIAIPVFNGERWLSETIDAFLAQTFTDFELIISDNCSTDSTATIARNYAERDSRVRYCKNERNIGAAENYNTAFRLATGKYFKWSSSNDLCAPTYLERCAEILDRHSDVVVSFPRTTLINEVGEKIKEYPENLHLMQDSPFERFEALLQRMGLCNVEQALVRSDVMRKTGMQGSFSNTDTILMAEIATHGKFYQIEEFLFYRRIAPSASTTLISREEWGEFNALGKTLVHDQTFEQMRAYFAMLPRVPVPARDRLKLFVYNVKWVWWSKKKLWKDFVAIAAK